MIRTFRPCLWLLAALLPVLLPVQGYPQVHYLTGLERTASGGDSGGPDWGSHDSYSYIHAPGNCLLITQIDHHHQGWMSDFPPSDYYETLDFTGALTLYPDHYLITSPLTLEANVNPTRKRKMDYQGHCHEDDWFGYNNNHYHAWHSYNADMKLVRTVIKKTSQPNRWWDSVYTIDSLGRRVEELTLSSADSLNWVNYRRRQYFYTGEQFPPGYQFEKHSQQLPDYILDYTTVRVPYLNDSWIISQMTEQTANAQGVWYDGETMPYNTELDADTGEVTAHYHWSPYNIFNSEGLLILAVVVDGDGVPSYDFYFANTSDTAVSEDVPPLAETLRAWPNPARENAALSLPGKFSGPLTLSTYNLRGQMLKEETRAVDAINRDLIWQARDEDGKAFESGIYLIRVEGRGFCQTARVMVLR